MVAEGILGLSYKGRGREMVLVKARRWSPHWVVNLPGRSPPWWDLSDPQTRSRRGWRWPNAKSSTPFFSLKAFKRHPHWSVMSPPWSGKRRRTGPIRTGPWTALRTKLDTEEIWMQTSSNLFGEKWMSRIYKDFSEVSDMWDEEKHLYRNGGLG